MKDISAHAEDEKYMRRALQLARLGQGHVSPNPMVGCIIVSADGHIVGEGWHRQYGSAHAEVNAVAAVRDPDMLIDATVYVTLEPCSHYGKTPPCADMLARLPVARIVAGMVDPNPKVSGRGLQRLRESGKEVTSGVLESECIRLNRHFLTAQLLHRPYITLKWACDAAGMMGRKVPDSQPLKFSSPMGQLWVHRLRTEHDAIMVSARTAINDNPRLTSTFWPGDNPRPIIAGNSPLPKSLWITGNNELLSIGHTLDLHTTMHNLYTSDSITSILVEGGRELLQAFIENRLYDEIRVETSPLHTNGDIPAPPTPLSAPDNIFMTQGNAVRIWYNTHIPVAIEFAGVSSLKNN